MVSESQETSVLILGIMLVLVLNMFIHILIKEWSKLSWLQESGATLIFGMAVGGIDYLLKYTVGWKIPLLRPAGYAEIFNLVLLPPIIFAAGFTMKKKDFFKNIGSIITLAVLGSLISTIFIGFFLFYFAEKGWITGISNKDPLESLIFGSLLSATDPVATLAIFQELNVDPLLYSLVFGESVLNDAVAIVIFRTLSNYIGTDIFNAHTVSLLIQDFIEIFLGSIAVGIGVGAISAVIMKFLQKYEEVPCEFEIAFVLLFGYSSYLVADLVGWSGIMALFFCGVMMSHYHWYSLSHHSKITLLEAVGTISSLADIAVFMSLGITMFEDKFESSVWNLPLIGFSLALCFISRLFNIFPLSLMLNIGRARKIPFRYQFLLWFSGLRGAIAVILAIGLVTEHKTILLNATIAIVLFTNLIVGNLTKPLLACLGIERGAPNTNVRTIADDHKLDKEDHTVFDSNVDITYMLNPEHPGKLHRFWRRFDDSIIKRYFGGQKRTVPIYEANELNFQPNEGDYLLSNNGRRSMSKKNAQTDDIFRDFY